MPYLQAIVVLVMVIQHGETGYHKLCLKKVRNNSILSGANYCAGFVRIQ